MSDGITLRRTQCVNCGKEILSAGDGHNLCSDCKSSNPVNHPSHYNHGKYECIDVMVDNFGSEFAKSFCLGNAFKYIYRAPYKSKSKEDIKKAKWYIEKWLELDESEDNCNDK